MDILEILSLFLCAVLARGASVAVVPPSKPIFELSVPPFPKVDSGPNYVLSPTLLDATFIDYKDENSPGASVPGSPESPSAKQKKKGPLDLYYWFGVAPKSATADGAPLPGSLEPPLTKKKKNDPLDLYYWLGVVPTLDLYYWSGVAPTSATADGAPAPPPSSSSKIPRSYTIWVYPAKSETLTLADGSPAPLTPPEGLYV